MNENIINLINNFDKITNNKRYELINKNNKDVIQLLKNELKNEKIINIVAKGPTATYIENAHAINQGIIFTNKKYLYLNDIHSLFGIEEFIKDIQYVFFPDYPHFNARSNPNITYLAVLKYLTKYNFNGNVFIYRLQTSRCGLLNNYSLRVSTTTTIPFIILGKWCNLKIFFHTYGYKIGKGYHRHLNDKVYKGKYEQRKQSYLWVAKTCNLPEKFCIDVCNRFERYYKVFNIIKPLNNGNKKGNIFIH